MKNKTNTRRSFLTSTMLSLACLAIGGTSALAQGYKHTQMYNDNGVCMVTISDKRARAGEIVSISTYLKYTGAGIHGWHPLSGKTVRCEIECPAAGISVEKSKATDGNGFVVFHYRVPEGLPPREFIIYMALKFDKDDVGRFLATDGKKCFRYIP
jgi:hypothetical protein